MGKSIATKAPKPGRGGKGGKRKSAPRPFLGNPAIHRIGLRAHVPRLAKRVYNDTRDMLRDTLAPIIRTAVIYRAHSRRQTIRADDIYAALVRHGQTVYGIV